MWIYRLTYTYRHGHRYSLHKCSAKDLGVTTQSKDIHTYIHRLAYVHTRMYILYILCTYVHVLCRVCTCLGTNLRWKQREALFADFWHAFGRTHEIKFNNHFWMHSCMNSPSSKTIFHKWSVLGHHLARITMDTNYANKDATACD